MTDDVATEIAVTCFTVQDQEATASIELWEETEARSGCGDGPGPVIFRANDNPQGPSIRDLERRRRKKLLGVSAP